MNIELTKEQYKTLLTMMYCGEWVLNSYKTKEDKIFKNTESLEQHIFSFAKNVGLEKWLEFDEKLNAYSPTAKMEDEIHIHIDKYNKRQKEL